MAESTTGSGFIRHGNGGHGRFVLHSFGGEDHYKWLHNEDDEDESNRRESRSAD